MRKTGCERIKEVYSGRARGKCINCGKEGNYRVTFEEDWTKIVIILCAACSKKEYEELNLQHTLKFPSRQKKEV